MVKNEGQSASMHKAHPFYPHIIFYLSSLFYFTVPARTSTGLRQQTSNRFGKLKQHSSKFGFISFLRYMRDLNRTTRCCMTDSQYTAQDHKIPVLGHAIFRGHGQDHHWKRQRACIIRSLLVSTSRYYISHY